MIMAVAFIRILQTTYSSSASCDSFFISFSLKSFWQSTTLRPSGLQIVQKSYEAESKSLKILPKSL